MRFKITLRKIGKGRLLPINYQYELSAIIYKLIDRGDSDFSKFLHDQGYLVGNRHFRLFTFSRLTFQGYKILRDSQRIDHYGEVAQFEISFLVDRAAEEFVKGVFASQEFRLADSISGINYQVSHIEAVAKPRFNTTMCYRCLSPILIKEKRSDGGENYLDPNSTNYLEILVQNMVSKTHAILFAGIREQLAYDFEEKYNLTVLGKIYKNGVTIKQHTEAETKLIGYMYKFELTVPTEFHEIGYYAGFGHLGSQGFGCVRVINEEV